MTSQEMDTHIAYLIANLGAADVPEYTAKMRVAIEANYSQQIAGAIYDAVHNELLAVKCKTHPT